jgi:hypothetical protein
MFDRLKRRTREKVAAKVGTSARKQIQEVDVHE